MSDFTDQELKALAINAMGRGIEMGSNPAYRLMLAVPEKNGLIDYPKGNNSGYTVGFFQWDFGAKGKTSAEGLINAYNQWAKPEDRIQDTELAVTKLRMNRDRGLDGQPHIRNSDLGKKINVFLASDAGNRHVMSLQEQQFNEALLPDMKMAAKSKAVQGMSDDDARITLAVVAKVKNQWGNINDIKNALNDQNNTKDKMLEIIHQKYSSVVDKGVDHTIEGAKIYNRLQNDKSTIGGIFRDQMQQNPTLTGEGFSQNPKAQLLDAMFRNPLASEGLLDAYSQGNKALIVAPSRIKDEAYSVALTKEGTLLTIDKNGKGYALDKNPKAVWREFDNEQEKLLQINPKTKNWEFPKESKTPPAPSIDTAIDKALQTQDKAALGVYGHPALTDWQKFNFSEINTLNEAYWKNLPKAKQDDLKGEFAKAFTQGAIEQGKADGPIADLADKYAQSHPADKMPQIQPSANTTMASPESERTVRLKVA